MPLQGIQNAKQRDSSQKDLVINTDAYASLSGQPGSIPSRNPTLIQGEVETPQLYRGKQQSDTYTGGSGDPTLIQGDLETRPLYRGI